jgi:hypothetical protein
MTDTPDDSPDKRGYNAMEHAACGVEIDVSRKPEAQASVRYRRVFNSIEQCQEFYCAELRKMKAERDEWIGKCRAIELANKEMSRNDHVTFGAIMNENQSLKAQLEDPSVNKEHWKKEYAHMSAMFQEKTNHFITAADERDQALAECERLKERNDNQCRSLVEAEKEITQLKSEIEREAWSTAQQIEFEIQRTATLKELTVENSQLKIAVNKATDLIIPERDRYKAALERIATGLISRESAIIAAEALKGKT